VSFLLIGTAAFTIAAEKPTTTTKPPTTVTQPGTLPIPQFTCPAGWHKKKQTSEEFKCAPNKPAPVKCPEGWKYVEALDCQGSQGLGTQVLCSGCEVGCNKIIVIK
jgi:hypothetical protein